MMDYMLSWLVAPRLAGLGASFVREGKVSFCSG